MGVVFDYYFDEPKGEGRIRVSGETDGLVVVTAVGGVRSSSPQRVELTFDEASTLRSLLSQALFIKQDEREREAAGEVIPRVVLADGLTAEERGGFFFPKRRQGK